MIIQNGHIAFAIHEVEGGIDPETGYPTPVVAPWSDEFPCQYNPASQNLQARYGAEHGQQIKWEVFVEQDSRLPQSAAKARLTDRNGNVVGEYAITEIVPLDAVLEVKYIL